MVDQVHVHTLCLVDPNPLVSLPPPLLAVCASSCYCRLLLSLVHCPRGPTDGEKRFFVTVGDHCSPRTRTQGRRDKTHTNNNDDNTSSAQAETERANKQENSERILPSTLPLVSMSRFLIVLCVCLLASTFPLLAAAANGDSSDPILYISMHGGKDGVNNIYSYSLDGTLIQQDVLQGDANADEMRSGIILPDRTLLITNAHKTDSRIVQYSACDSNGNRQYVSDWATTNVAHPYGLASGLDAAAGDQVVWATNQDTFDLVQFGSHGTFQEQVKAFGSEEIRSIAYDEISNVLYVANENEDAVLAYNTKTSQWGQHTHTHTHTHTPSL